ncbi:MAG: phosphocholine cytidylyltransferase family protein [Sporichthyaceae bacterium]
MELQVSILAAGMGTRLGRPFPKPLTELANGKSIMAQQVDNLRGIFGKDLRITVVVGFKHDLIMERFPDVLFAYNENYDQTNTSKSLLRALGVSHVGGVLWLNGDVVFDQRILETLRPLIEAEQTFVCVNTEAVGDEEVKYNVDDRGFIRELSKTVSQPLGEAVGINYVASTDKAVLMEHLENCDDQEYFERGIETAVASAGMLVRPVDISEFYAVEVDFEGDLERANTVI